MYTILTTYPDYGSRNVGDRLIELRLKSILAQEKQENEFLTIFREDSLEQRLDEINASRAILMPGFPIRDTPMYPNTYRLVPDLSDIRVPLIPIGANWNVYPGDAQSRREVQYSDATTDFLRYVAGQVEQVSCREHYVCGVLQKHGVENTIMTGDPAMFCLSKIGTPMKQPTRIERVVFSPPLSPFYAEQADRLLSMLAEMFPSTTRICAFHLADSGSSTSGRSENSAAMTPAVADKNRRIRDRAEELGYQILDMAGNVKGLSIYEACDLHVGYECHAHLYFLSMRSPSVLIAEDARGVGFNQTILGGGFDGFTRKRASTDICRKRHTSGYCTSLDELSVAPPREDLHKVVKDFLKHQLATGFREYAGVAPWLDRTYECAMAPFIRAIP